MDPASVETASVKPASVEPVSVEPVSVESAARGEDNKKPTTDIQANRTDHFNYPFLKLLIICMFNFNLIEPLSLPALIPELKVAEKEGKLLIFS